MGRYVSKKNRLKPWERLCKHCDLNTCENEQHLVLFCKYYQAERKEFLQKILKLFPHVKQYSSKVLYQWLMGNTNELVLNMLSKYVYTCFKKRSEHSTI